MVNPNIFRSYDIRGVYGQDIDEQLFEKIGNAFAQHVSRDILVARDARVSSEKLLQSFTNGALRAEKTVMNIGQVPLSVAMDWAVSQQLDLAYVTASHLGKEWNGVKFFHYDGLGFSEEENFAVRDLVLSGKYFSGLRAMPVREEVEDVLDLYISHVTSKMPVSEKKLKILIDCGNGTAGIIVKRLFNVAGFDVDLLFEKPDGTFPNRRSDPGEDTLDELRRRVKNYDFGLAFDGDADRFAVVTKDGVKLSPEQTAFVVLGELLKEKKGTIVANVECSMLLDDIARRFECDVMRCRVGHTFLMENVLKNNAVFGMEFTGHYVLPFLTSFDDAIAVSLYFSHALEKSARPLSDILKDVPVYNFGRVNFECSDGSKFSAVAKIKNHLSQGHKINDIDGVRIDFDDGWALVRASNTSPAVRLTIEAKTPERFEELKNYMSHIVQGNL